MEKLAEIRYKILCCGSHSDLTYKSVTQEKTEMLILIFVYLLICFLFS